MYTILTQIFHWYVYKCFILSSVADLTAYQSNKNNEPIVNTSPTADMKGMD